MWPLLAAATIEVVTAHRRFGPLIAVESILTLLCVAALLAVVDALFMITTDHGLDSNASMDGWGSLYGSVELIICLYVLLLVCVAMVEVWVRPSAGYRTARGLALGLIALVVVLWFLAAMTTEPGPDIFVPFVVALSPLMALLAAAHVGARKP